MTSEHDTDTDAAIAQRIKASYDAQSPPEALWERISASARDSKAAATMRPPKRRRIRLAAAAVALLAAGLLLFQTPWLDRFRSGDVQDVLASALAQEFATFIASGRSLDISSQDRTTVQTWLSERMDAAPPGPPARPGVRLAGARLCNIMNRRVAAYMYDLGGTAVSLYVTKPTEDASGIHTPPVLVEAHDRYSVAVWRNGHWQFSAIADLPPKDLVDVASRLATAS